MKLTKNSDEDLQQQEVVSLLRNLQQVLFIRRTVRNAHENSHRKATLKMYKLQ